MPDCFPVPLFRAYIRRKPSGLLLVTVLSAALPRPLFRMYPAELGEVAAVERSVRHALESLHQRTPDKTKLSDNQRLKHVFSRCHEHYERDSDNICGHSHALLPAVNVVVAEPQPLARFKHTAECEPESDQPDYCGYAEKKNCGIKGVFQHGSPQLIQACTKQESYNSDEPCLDSISACSDKVSEDNSHNNCAFLHSSPQKIQYPLIELRKFIGNYFATNENCANRCRDSTSCKHGCKNMSNKISHGSPHVVQHASQHFAVSSAEQEGVEGYAVKHRCLLVWQGLL